MHLKTRPMHVIWIFGSGFYVRRQVPRSNCCCCCCCLRFPPTLSHTGTRLHATQSDSTHMHIHIYTFICFGANWQRVTFSRITCVFHHNYLMDLCRVQIIQTTRFQTKCILLSIYFWRPFCWVSFSFFFFLNPLQSSFSTFDLVVHVRARASHLVVARLLSGPSHPQATTTFSRRRRLHNAPLGHIHTHDTLTKTNTRIQTETNIHTYIHAYVSTHIITAAKTKNSFEVMGQLKFSLFFTCLITLKL